MLWTTTLQGAHYKTTKLEKFTFLVINTKTKIILGHPASDRLGLTQVLCHNKAKWVRTVKRSGKHVSKANQFSSIAGESPPKTAHILLVPIC